MGIGRADVDVDAAVEGGDLQSAVSMRQVDGESQEGERSYKRHHSIGFAPLVKMIDAANQLPLGRCVEVFFVVWLPPAPVPALDSASFLTSVQRRKV